MDPSAVAGCFRDKTILVTGSTGFLGKCMPIYIHKIHAIYVILLVEKILRVQPDVKRLYLLVRAPDAVSAEQRVLSQVLEKDLFNTLREKHGLTHFERLVKQKIVPLAGDTGFHNFGLDGPTVEALCEEIDVVVNGAATTNFYERYDVALASNVLGAKYGCEFAKKCRNLKLLLHVSTAFVAGTQEGLLLEKALQMGESLRQGYHLDIETELRLVEKVKTELAAAKSGSSDQSEKTALKELGFNRASHFGWPNVYAFTKAMGEMLLEQHREDLPVVIIRPTMVTSTYQDPFPGWIEGARTIDAMIVAYDKQSFPCFVGDRKDIMDVVSNTQCHSYVVAMGDKLSLLFYGLFAEYYKKHNRRYTFLMLLVKLYAPYAFFKGCFDDTNLTRLMMEVKMDGKDGNIFNFDLRSIDWHSYLLSVHVPAVLKYGRKKKRSV
ncbi:hypothetical protein ACQ4PT_067238 [Festuca glaucescens]